MPSLKHNGKKFIGLHFNAGPRFSSRLLDEKASFPSGEGVKDR
jgi:hypothetical protein